MASFREMRDRDVTGQSYEDTSDEEPLDEEQQFDEPYVVGLDKSGEYVTKHRNTGKLLNSSDFPHYDEEDYFDVNSGDNFAFFENYKGQFVNGKREGTGKYTAMTIEDGQSTLDFTGQFVNNLPYEGELKFTNNGEFVTTINGFFVDGLPDETKECEVVYRKGREEIRMKGLISFRNQKGELPRDIGVTLTSNKPYNLLHIYLSYLFKVSGTKQTYPPIETGVFSSRGEKVLLGGMRSKKRSNYKRNSHKKYY
jgi:hypothetical protein